MRIRHSNRRHGGSTIAESALVLSMFLLFMFGIFEYGRFLFLTQVATNAARAGVRYATVNVDKPSNFDLTDYNSTTPCIKNYVILQMGGADTMIQGFDVSTFPCDTTAMYADPPVIQAQASYTAWNSASFTQRIGVKIIGNYKPILPVFVFFLSSTTTIPLNITACSGSEG
jgi:Flp pilus assembly protein TadG